MNNKIKCLYIVGAGGHARSLLNLLEINDYIILGIYDETYSPLQKEIINGYNIIGKLDKILPTDKLIVAIGNNLNREKLFHLYQDQIIKESIIHPSSVIERNTYIGLYNQIFALTYINSNVTIGYFNIINTGCIIEHEVKMGNNNHLSVNSIICGRVTIGNNCFIGASATVIDKINICDNVIIGANSTIINNIAEPGVYVGNPARKVK